MTKEDEMLFRQNILHDVLKYRSVKHTFDSHDNVTHFETSTIDELLEECKKLYEFVTTGKNT